ncbi:MAG: hypothetical protein ACYC8V_14590 [Caulobacteraceae bacterium]
MIRGTCDGPRLRQDLSCCCNDTLNRLTSVNSNGALRSARFDAEVDIQTKSDVGTYSYGVGAGPHAVTSVTGVVNGVTNPTAASWARR